jgi:Prokaryotic N-terminal methylation motif
MRHELTKKMKITKKSSSRGFTLSELLVGATLTTVVVGAAGYGISNMITSSNATSTRSESRAELNRAVDYISSEVRESTDLVQNVATATEPSNFAASYTNKIIGSPTKVLMIKNAETGGVPIIYYVAQPATGIWKGPRVVYRWGPTFNADGSFANASTPSTWVSEALVDNIQDVSMTTAALGTTPTCDNGGTYNGAPGFYACVDAAGKTAQIFQNGKIAKVVGPSENYNASTNTGSRKTAFTRTASITAPGAPATTPIFNIVNGGVEVLKDSTVTVQTLPPPSGGGSGYPWATSIRVAVQPKGTTFTDTMLQAGTLQSDARAATTQTYTIPAGKTISIAACSNSTGNMAGTYSTDNTSYKVNYCPTSTNTAHQGNLSSYTNYATSLPRNGKNVFTLKNGDEIPSVKPASGQSSAAAFLSAYSDPADATSTVKHLKLASNQVIYLFELYTTDKQNGLHDLQDTVVLVTFN